MDNPNLTASESVVVSERYKENKQLHCNNRGNQIQISYHNPDQRYEYGKQKCPRWISIRCFPFAEHLVVWREEKEIPELF